MATSGCSKQKFQLDQSNSYIVWKVWYHQIWFHGANLGMYHAFVVRAQIDGRGRVTLSHLLQRKVDYIFVATTELCLDRVGFFLLWN